MFNTHLKDSEHVSDQISFYLLIYGCIVVEWGQVIDFKQPWLKFAV
jgi:hypothetical protein